jgi:hypothetical protein
MSSEADRHREVAAARFCLGYTFERHFLWLVRQYDNRAASCGCFAAGNSGPRGNYIVDHRRGGRSLLHCVILAVRARLSDECLIIFT